MLFAPGQEIKIRGRNYLIDSVVNCSTRGLGYRLLSFEQSESELGFITEKDLIEILAFKTKAQKVEE